MAKSRVVNAIQRSSTADFMPIAGQLSFPLTSAASVPIGFPQTTDRLVGVSNPSATALVWLGLKGSDAELGKGVMIPPLTTFRVEQMSGNGGIEAISTEDVTVGVQLWEREVL